MGKLAQEILETNTEFKTDVVLILTHVAVDALIKSVGSVYIEGQGYVSGNSIEFVRNEQYNEGKYRGNAVKSLMEPIINSVKIIQTIKSSKKQIILNILKALLLLCPMISHINL